MSDGLRAACGAGTEPGTAGSVAGPAAGYGVGDDDQYGLWKRTEGGCACGTGGDGRRCGDCGGGWNGVDVECALPLATGSQGISHGGFHGGGLHGGGWI